ncbi:MAG TPA: 4-(cytidine 5'-diphospho)-2-C-methyl-D-erythritol kinase [bacterium]|nr:4-(cytidine 5'-diphospho)-2-C-methyl-D-erythritol kinase [bacterium]
MSELTLRSNAKINLGLRIVGRRPDGYHLIDTIFQEIDFSDVLTFSHKKGTGVELQCDDPALPVDETNLCVRAYHLLAQQFPEMGAARISLDKRIPVGAGLGGGSSNAATTLLGLSKLLDLPVTETLLTTLAQKLGADVPFFLYGGIARGTGIGEEITPLPAALDRPIVLVIPEIRISTRWAYENVRYTLTKIVDENKFKGFFDNWEEDRRFTNVFEPLIVEQYSKIGEVRNRLLHLQADYVSLSGSGSAIFGIFPDEAAADPAVAEFTGHYRCELVTPVHRDIPRMRSIFSE